MYAQTHLIPTTSNPQQTQRPYEARGAAVQMWRCRDLEIVIEGPAGTGKSRAVLEKLHRCCLKYSGMRGLIVRKTRESMTESVLVTFEDQVLPEGSPLKAGPQRKNRSSYRYDNGSIIVVAGLLANGKDQKAKVMSTEYDMICIFEATELTETEYEQLLTRLRNGVMPYQQLIADCNPDAPTHWLHQRSDAGTATTYFSRHEDNPRWYDTERQRWTAAGTQYVLGTLEQLTGVRKERLRYGRRRAVEGAVYDFDRTIHLIDAMPRGWETWRKVRAIDFGFRNPFVCQWWAIDYDERMYLYREIYMSNRTVKVLAQQITNLSTGEVYESTITDHDAEDRATLEENGIPTQSANKGIMRGIEKVQERLKIAGDGRPRLYIIRDCLVELDPLLAEAKLPTCTLQEFDSYVYPKGVDGKPNKETPIDKDNHGMDTMRYTAMYVDGATATLSESVTAPTLPAVAQLRQASALPGRVPWGVRR